MDPLSSLRDSVKAKYPISFRNQTGTVDTLSKATHIVLSSQQYAKGIPTTFRKPGATATDPQSDPASFYPLEALYLAWKFKDVTGAEYMKQAREHGLLGSFVSVTERKGLVDWLEGRTSHHANIIVPGMHDSRMLRGFCEFNSQF